MAGKRQPLAVLQANGRKHLTKAEIAERSAAEVHLKKPKRISVPAWLPEDLKGDFRKISKELLDADLGASQLDRDTIGRLVVAQAQYAAATSWCGTRWIRKTRKPAPPGPLCRKSISSRPGPAQMIWA